MFEKIKRIFQEETLAERSQRMKPAALYAALVATVYVLTLSLVNVFSFPHLPLGISGVQVLRMWIVLSVAFGLFGALAAWFTEEYEGVVAGGALITVLILLLSALISAGTSALTGSIVSALPLVGVSMLASWGIRWAARRHLAIQREPGPVRRKALAKHIGTILLLGLIPGILGRMDRTSEKALLQLHQLLQAAPSDPSVLPQLPLKQVPALPDHFGVPYKLYPRPSTLAVGSLDVTVKFADGFVMTCNLPLGGGNRFITDCNEGAEIQNGQ